MYKILGADQKEYGPVSAEVVRQWIAERRANAQTRIQLEGTAEWKPLSEFPEFQDALAMGAPPPNLPGPPPPPAAMPAMTAPPKTSGLAIASLVMGILGFCTGITSVVGLILGTMALLKISNSQGKLGGKGLAIAGLVISGLVVSMTVAILPGMMLPALAKAKARAQSINCISNLKQIGLAARMYANDHEQTFPRDFLSMSNELVNPKLLVCPGDSSKTRSLDWSTLTPQNISYEMVSPGMKEDAASQVFARCPIHGHVCRGDGSVQSGDRGRRR